MKVLFRIFTLMLLAVLFTEELKAQEYDENGYTANSLRPFHRDDILFQKRVWREINLDEKQNRPFMSVDNEIIKIIIEAAKAGRIPIYKNDSLNTRMTKEEFLEQLEDPELKDRFGGDDDAGAWGGGGGGAWGAEPEAVDEGPADIEFSLNDISIIEVMEDFIFDRKRSRAYWDILSFTIVVPAYKKSTIPFNIEIATFKYADLHELFKEMGDKAIWFNAQNSAEHRNFADAFDLRLFSSRIIKVANPDNDKLENYADVMGNAKKAMYFQLQKEYELMEIEHELWEY